MRTTSIISTIALMGLLASCGDDGKKSSSGSPHSNDTAVEREENADMGPLAADGSNIDGHYLATFTTLNPQVNGTLPGSASFFRKDDKLHAYVRLFAGGPKAWHQQKVYVGNRCPTLSDDTNGDGFIDILEAEAVLGQVLIPLDADLNSQNAGRNFYPLGDLSGSYFYERIVNFKRFFDDLKSEDKDTSDNITKLGPDEPLIIEGKAVMIQGVSESVELPETVEAGTMRYRPFQTLPIACGIFEKMTTHPGRPDDGVIPGPVADVEEDQDRPAPDEDMPTEDESGGPRGNTGTGSNEADRGETETTDESGNSSSNSRSSVPSSSTPVRESRSETRSERRSEARANSDSEIRPENSERVNTDEPPEMPVREEISVSEET